MTDTKNAWPSKQYDGSMEKYEEYATDTKAWAIEKDYDEHLNGEPPKETDYTGNGSEGRFRAAMTRDRKKGNVVVR